jgi:superfamily II DNA or RNA helicase
MFEMMSGQTNRKLWKHQADALDFAINHLNKSDDTCLIRMPTGTGKTGVIACLTRLSNQNSSLVLTPWANLRDQMISDLETDFWKKVGLKPNDVEVIEMLPSTAKEVLNFRGTKVIVATFATLNDLRRDHSEIYSSLADTISLVIVDEGHYEPAVEWGKSVKGLNTKTLLLTATPYRNDLKLFRITDPQKSTHHFTHKQAIEKSIIREASFETLDSLTDIQSLSEAFVEKWLEAKKKKKLPSRTPRAILCCSGATEIESTVAFLRRAGLKALGVHEQFEDSKDPNLLKEVPDPQSTDWDIWVHQNKLTEGLDDHRFCCVAFFTKIRNDRKMIQQVGRILRRDANDLNTPAIILSPIEYSVESAWKAYREFETELRLLEPQHFRNVIDKILDLQPHVEYFDKRFRTRFNPADLTQNPQVIIPPSVLVRAASKDFSLEDYIEDCTDTLNTKDAVILGPYINAPCQKSDAYALWVYASFRNSRFLHNSSLYEIKLETHCIVLVDDIVLMTDSKGNFPEEYLEDHTFGVSPEKLARFLDKSFRPTHVNINSSIPYDRVFRGAELRGHDILNIPTSLTDRVQICRSVRGSSRKSGRRYVGMSNGRLRKEISEENRRSFELDTFVTWAKSVAKILNSKISSNAVFHRYMPTCAPPTNPVPKTISIDILSHNLSMSFVDGHECRFKNSSSEIKMNIKADRAIYTCSFDLESGGAKNMSITLRVEYNPAKRRFWFNKETGAAVQVSIEDNEVSVKSLTEFLNQKQDIILIGLDDGETVYQGRNFYKIDYSYAEQVLLNLINRPNVSPCTTEKGSKKQIDVAKQIKTSTFPDGSLFKAVAERQIKLPFRDNLLICADLGTECADFIAANINSNHLALIHVKAGSGRKVSASAFHDVVSQAMKNLVYLSKNDEIPEGANSWLPNSKWNKTGVPRLYRTLDKLPSGKSLWNKLTSDIIGSSNPGLYVILVTTGCCNLDELKKATNNPQMRTPETAQLFHLLDGLNGYARQLGIRLLVYDVPYKPG